MELHRGFGGWSSIEASTLPKALAGHDMLATWRLSGFCERSGEEVAYCPIARSPTPVPRRGDPSSLANVVDGRHKARDHEREGPP